MKKIILTIILLMAPLSCLADTPWGVNMHLRERVDQDDWDEVINKAKEGGIEWVREEFNWDVIEPTNDTFSWDQYDAVINKYQENDIQVLGLLTYSSSWASTNPGADDYKYYYPELDPWKDYVAEVAEHYKDSITYWEIWNEPNHSGFWKNFDDTAAGAAQYATHLEEASEAIKAVNPEAKIVLGGLSGTDYDWLKIVYEQIENKDSFDIVAIHPYRVKDGNFNYSPEYTTDGLNTLLVDLKSLDRLMRAKGDKDKPIWITEIGWTTYSEGVNNKAQANMLMRSFVQALSMDQVEKVFWYDFRNDSNYDFLESNFGLVETDLTEKKSFSAYQFLNEHLRGYIQSKGPVLTSQAKLIDNFTSKGNWSYVKNNNAKAWLSILNNSLKVKYKFKSSDNSYLQINNSIALADDTRALSFRVKGDNKRNILKLRIEDASGEVFQYELGQLGKKWQTYQVPLKNYNSNWNGDGNGELDRPLKFVGFILDDNPDGNQKSGTIYFDGLAQTSDGNAYVYKFLKDGEKTYVVWNTSGTKSLRIKLGKAKKIRIYSLDSNDPKVKTSTNGYFNLKASYTPKIIKVVN